MFYLAIKPYVYPVGTGGHVVDPGETTPDTSYEVFPCTENTWVNLVSVPGIPTSGMWYIETFWKEWEMESNVKNFIEDYWGIYADWEADASTIEDIHANSTRIFMNSDKSISAWYYPRRVTGLFVRGNEVQASYNDGSLMRTPDWGKTWYDGTSMPIPTVDVVFDADNVTRSYAIGSKKIYRPIDDQAADSDFVYKSTGSTLSGCSICAEMPLDYSVCFIATNKALQKTFDGGDTLYTVLAISGIIDFAVGSSNYGNEVQLCISADQPTYTKAYINAVEVSLPYSGGYSFGIVLSISGCATGGKVWDKWETDDLTLYNPSQALQNIELWSDVSLIAYVKNP